MGVGKRESRVASLSCPTRDVKTVQGRTMVVETFDFEQRVSREWQQEGEIRTEETRIEEHVSIRAIDAHTASSYTQTNPVWPFVRLSSRFQCGLIPRRERRERGMGLPAHTHARGVSAARPLRVMQH